MASCEFVIVPERRFAPIDEVATTFPVVSTPSTAEEREVSHVVPALVSCVVEAFASCVKPVKVEEACERSPDWKAWRDVHVFAVVVPKEVESVFEENVRPLPTAAACAPPVAFVERSDD